MGEGSEVLPPFYLCARRDGGAQTSASLVTQVGGAYLGPLKRKGQKSSESEGILYPVTSRMVGDPTGLHWGAGEVMMPLFLLTPCLEATIANGYPVTEVPSKALIPCGSRDH